MSDGQRRLGALLLEMGVIDELQLERALDAQRRTGQRLGRALVDSCLVNEDLLVDALSNQLGIERWQPELKPSQESARALLTWQVAVRAMTLPLERLVEDGRETVVMATSDPLAPSAGRVVRSLSERGLVVHWLLARETELERSIRASYGFSPSSEEGESGVTVIRGRPERPPGNPGEPPTSKEGPTTRPPSPVETELVEALDAALGEGMGRQVLQDRVVHRIPKGSAPSIGTAKSARKTLVADDAVLEIIDVSPGEVRQPEVPKLNSEEGAEHSGLRETLHEELSPDARDQLQALNPQTASRPNWARAARSERTNWGELVPGRAEEVAPTPEDIRVSSKEPVALARVAIRRPDGGIREVMSQGAKQRDPREGYDGSSEPEEAAVKLEVLTPVPHLQPSELPDVSRSPSPYASSSNHPEPPSLGPVSDERPAPNLVATIVEHIEETSGASDSREFYGRQEGSSDGPPAEGTPAHSEKAESEEQEDDDGFGTEPTIVSADIQAAGKAQSDGVLQTTADVIDETPTSRTDTSSAAGASTIELPRELPIEPPPESRRHSSETPINEVPRRETPAPVRAKDAALPEIVSPEDRASELHARLIRYAAGEDLPEKLRDELLRLVVALLLDQGMLNEQEILRFIRDKL